MRVLCHQAGWSVGGLAGWSVTLALLRVALFLPSPSPAPTTSYLLSLTRNYYQCQDELCDWLVGGGGGGGGFQHHNKMGSFAKWIWVIRAPRWVLTPCNLLLPISRLGLLPLPSLLPWNVIFPLLDFHLTWSDCKYDFNKKLTRLCALCTLWRWASQMYPGRCSGHPANCDRIQKESSLKDT